jgi:hypothetical protein
MAEAAVAAVLNPDASDAYQRFETELVIRESCGCGEASADASPHAGR